MDNLQRKLGRKNFVHYNPSKPTAGLAILDRAISSRRGGGGGDPSQQASREGGSGGGVRGGKGKEREKEVYIPSAKSEADKKRQRIEKQRADLERAIQQRKIQQREDDKAAKEREEAGHGPTSMDLSDDDDLPDVGAIGISQGRGRTKATSTSKESEGKRARRRTSSPPPSKLKLAPTSSPPLPLPVPPKQASLPNFKKKDRTATTSHAKPPPAKSPKSDTTSFFFQPKASSSKPPILDLDSPKKQKKKNASKTVDLDSPSPPPSPRPPPISRKPNGSRQLVPPSESSDLDDVEDALSPQKHPPPPPPRPKPQPKLAVDGVIGVGGVSNPFGIKNQPIASSSSSSSSKHLQPSNSDAPFKQPSSSKLSSTTCSKPSKLGKKSSNKLPDSSSEEEEEEKDEKEKVTNVGGVEFKTMVRKKVMLSPGGLAKKRAADELKAVMKPGEEYDELVDTEEDEEVDTVVDLRKKKKEMGRKEVGGGGGGGRTELKAKRSILEIAAEEMEAGLKDKEDKERKLKHYGEDEEVYETDHPHPNPKLLCVFCSELLPPVPSPKLLALIKRLTQLSHPAPTIFNPHAVSLSMIKSINACTLHRSESKQFPIAEKNGWPMEIDWGDVQRRAKDSTMVKRLGEVIESKDANPFWQFAKERAEDVGVALARTAKGQYAVFEKAQPGYFGEIGQILFHQMLSAIFIPSRSNTSSTTYGPTLRLLTSTASSPLTPSDFVYFVLIPELAIRLIQQDLNLTDYLDGYNVMLNSRAYGNSRFAAEEGEAAGGVLMQGWDEDGEEMEDGVDDGILVSRRRRADSGDGDSSGKGRKEKDAPKGLRLPSSPPSDDGGRPKVRPTAALSTSTISSSSNMKPHSFAIASSSKRPRSASPNPPPSKRRSPSHSPPPPPKPLKKKSSPSNSTPKPTPIHPFFKAVAKKEPTVVASPPPPPLPPASSSSATKKSRPKPKPALAPSSSSSSTTINAVAGSSKPIPRLKTPPPKIDLDSEDEEGEEGEKRKREEREKTVTPPKLLKSKKEKEMEYAELEEEGESQETTVPESPKGKKGKRKEEEQQERDGGGGKKFLKRSHSMKRTESEKGLWVGMDSDDIDFDDIFNGPDEPSGAPSI